MLLFVVVVFYFYLKLDVFINKKDVDIMTSFKEGALDTDFVMTYDAGLNFAVAFTAFDEVREPILDKSIGEIVFKAWEWGEDSEGQFFTRRNTIASRMCTASELGLEGREQSKFFVFNQDRYNEVNYYQQKFRCIDEDDIRMYGDFNSQKARLLNV